MHCDKCGKPLKEGAMFCNYCGNKVIEVDETRSIPTYQKQTYLENNGISRTGYTSFNDIRRRVPKKAYYGVGIVLAVILAIFLSKNIKKEDLLATKPPSDAPSGIIETDAAAVDTSTTDEPTSTSDSGVMAYTSEVSDQVQETTDAAAVAMAPSEETGDIGNVIDIMQEAEKDIPWSGWQDDDEYACAKYYRLPTKEGNLVLKLAFVGAGTYGYLIYCNEQGEVSSVQAIYDRTEFDYLSLEEMFVAGEPLNMETYETWEYKIVDGKIQETNKTNLYIWNDYNTEEFFNGMYGFDSLEEALLN